MFSTQSTGTAKPSRYTPASDAVATTRTLSDGTVVAGRVLTGTDRDGEHFLVHTVAGGRESSLPLYAVATAVASGKVIPPDAVAAAFAETGKLKALKAAVDKLAAE